MEGGGDGKEVPGQGEASDRMILSIGVGLAIGVA